MDHEPVAVPAHTPAAGGGLHTHATARAAGGRRRAYCHRDRRLPPARHRLKRRPPAASFSRLYASSGRRRAAEAHRASRTRLPLRDPEHFTEVRLDRPLVGGDAAERLARGVHDRVGSPGEDAEQALRSGDGWASAHQVFRTAPWPDRAPTTVALSPY